LQPLEESLFLFNQVALRAGPEADNKMKVACDHLKHRFLDLTKVVFWTCKEAEKDL